MRDVNLDAGETITRSVREHWFVLVINILPLLLLALFPILFIPLLRYIASLSSNGTTLIPVDAIQGNGLVRLGYGLWLLMLWSAAFNIVTSWYLNLWVVTNTRIININQYGYFSREISSVLLARVQDVSSDVTGLFGTLLGYGHLQVQSAGENEHFIMDNVADPQGLRDLIMSEIAVLHAQTKPTAHTDV